MPKNPNDLRACENCKNLFQLNLFRPDGFICRFCELGVKVPTYMLKPLKEEIFDDITITSKEINDSKEEIL